MTDQFYDLPENPRPSGGEIGHFQAIDRITIRYARFRPEPGLARRGTIIVLSGRNEHIEKYFETIGDLTARGFHVAMADWRGQGGSQRLLSDRERGYVRSFQDYVADLHTFLDKHVSPEMPAPYYILAHSTGGLIALLAAPRLTNRIRRMVLSAPLIGLHGLPVSMRTVRRISGLVRLTGFGWMYATGGPRKRHPFATNMLTSDLKRYERNRNIVETHPVLGMGGPTATWLNRVCHAVDTVTDPDFMARIQIPTLFVLAGADEVVSTSTTERFARGLRSGVTVTIDGARHELLQEADIYRDQFFSAFDAFIPGSDAIFNPQGADGPAASDEGAARDTPA
ncbi:MAG: alpha/beta hydrolase [Rhizobiaceae bacterium]